MLSDEDKEDLKKLIRQRIIEREKYDREKKANNKNQKIIDLIGLIIVILIIYINL